jgi:hypothetical protein
LLDSHDNPDGVLLLVREIMELQSLAATRRRISSLITPLALLIISTVMLGCGIKTTIKVPPKPSFPAFFKTSNFDELIKITKNFEKIDRLSCVHFELTYTSTKKIDSGILEKYKTLEGHILLKRTDSVRLVLRVPIINTRLFELLSVGDDLSLDYPRENKFFRGKNSASVLTYRDPENNTEFSSPLRGPHIFEAIFPQGIDTTVPGTWVSLEEQMDEHARYYVLSVHRESAPPMLQIIRKIWIERSGLNIARQQIFSDKGMLVSDISYSDHKIIDGFSLPLSIHIDRRIDGYILDLKFKSWNINPAFSEESFIMEPPANYRILNLGAGDSDK